MELIDGNQIAAIIVAELKTQVAALPGRKPCLALVRIGDDPASVSYVRKKENRGRDRVTSRIILPPVTTTRRVVCPADQLNLDSEVDGILVQSPLPKHIDEVAVFRRVAPEKDVDGFNTLNLGKVAQEDYTGFVSCTPAGIMELLARSGVDLKGKHVVVLGRSLIVGKPVALLALQKRAGANGTVTICHSATANLPGITRQADVLIAAIGRAEFVTADMVKPGAVVIDVGINRVPDPMKKTAAALPATCISSVAPLGQYAVPVCGSMTMAMLMKNTPKAFLLRSAH